jgi:hypothetical protein
VNIAVYRLLEHLEPSLDDFTSMKDKGQEPRKPDRYGLRLYSGLSTYKTEEQARSLDSRSPVLGFQAVAKLHISPDAAATIEFDTSRNGHCTLWSEPAELLGLIQEVLPL